MYFPRTSALFLVLCFSVSAQINVALILSELPTCVTKCALTEFETAACQLSDVQNCLCRNETLQAQLSICVQKSCNIYDQEAGAASQASLCVGVPQPSRSGEILRTAIILSAITFPIVLLRCISRYMVARRIWWDDCVALLSTLFAVGLSVIEIVNSQKGFGKHYWTIKESNGPLLLQLFYASQLLYITIQVLAKFSILLLYIRLFPSKPFRTWAMITVAFVLSHGFAFLMVAAFQCLPVRAIWDLTLDRKCLNTEAYIYAGAAFSILEDFIIIILPIFELRKLNLSMKKRLGLMVIFAFGSFACVTSIVRLRFIVYYGNSFDSTWDNVDVVKWSLIEVYTALICACLPSLRPLLKKCIPAIFQSTNNSTMRNSKRSKISEFVQIKRSRGGTAKDEELISRDLEMVYVGEEKRSGSSGQGPIVVERDFDVESSHGGTEAWSDARVWEKRMPSGKQVAEKRVREVRWGSNKELPHLPE